MGSNEKMILLDTHAWFFYINDSSENMSLMARRTIKDSDVLGVSIISCWEIAMLVAKQRLRFSIDVHDWIDRALKYKGIKLVGLDPDIAVLATRLPGKFHKDPADRIIVASCIKLGTPLVTLDERIKKWGYIKTIS
jgi:PIN domain nuclease of toxin-antitoxin system